MGKHVIEFEDDVSRKYDVSDLAFYKWRSKQIRMEVSEAKRLTTLEEENAKLKKLLVGRWWMCRRALRGSEWEEAKVTRSAACPHKRVWLMLSAVRDCSPITRKQPFAPLSSKVRTGQGTVVRCPSETTTVMRAFRSLPEA